MQQFLMIAGIHFLTLLSPGPDFFLIVRTSVAHGWRVASAACLGIALANGLFIVAAFAGLSVFQADSMLFLLFQCLGCLYLLYIGQLFLRYAGKTTLTVTPSKETSFQVGNVAWQRACLMGFMSGMLNPKNALFYVSLASVLAGEGLTAGWRVVYGVWMFSIVLIWDVLVAVAIGNHLVRRRFTAALPWLERCSGVALIALAVAVSYHVLTGLFT